MEFKGTKGKWEALLDQDFTGAYHVKTENGYPTDSEDIANAKLIASAPELLEEHIMDLKHLLSWKDSLIKNGMEGSDMFYEFIDMIDAKRAVIKKALGGE